MNKGSLAFIGLLHEIMDFFLSFSPVHLIFQFFSSSFLTFFRLVPGVVSHNLELLAVFLSLLTTQHETAVAAEQEKDGVRK